MDEAGWLSEWGDYVDWRNRPALRGRHGGTLAAFFVLVVEIMENLAYLANASNLVLYLSMYMHFSPSSSANIVTDFMGTAFLLALLGGFFADAFFNTYHIFLISAVIEFMGLLVLTLQARTHSLKPPPCPATPMASEPCHEVRGGRAGVLFAGLYLVALGVGGIKGSLPPHGAEQFDENTLLGRKQRSTFFNYFVFCLSCGALIAVTFVVWIEDNLGWQWGFGIATVAILLSVPIFLLGSPRYRIKVPAGSPITTILKVLLAAICNKLCSRAPKNTIMSMDTSPPSPEPGPGAPKPSEERDRTTTFLNRAAASNPVHRALECTEKQVEDVKIVLRTVPIFASTVMLNCCLAQLSTFSVQQAAAMDTRLGPLRVPPASLPVFPVVFVMALAPVYDHLVLPLARRARGSEMGVTHLERIGTGLALSVAAMGAAALVEARRKRAAAGHGPGQPMSFLWIALQFLFLGSADLFSLAGLLEFFFTEAPASMRSLATSFSWASLAMGYYLSSALVSLVNRATGWLEGRDLDHYRLERFYWLMCALSGLNFLNYLFWASRYKYRSAARGS